MRYQIIASKAEKLLIEIEKLSRHHSDGNTEALNDSIAFICDNIAIIKKEQEKLQKTISKLQEKQEKIISVLKELGD